MMHRLTALRRAHQQARASFQGEPLVRAIFTGTARKGYTASDLEALETIALPAHRPDGSRLPLAGYDAIESILSYP